MLPLIAFTSLYMMAAVAGAMVQGNKAFVFHIVVMLVLIGVVTLARRAVILSTALLWALMAGPHISIGIPAPAHRIVTRPQ